LIDTPGLDDTERFRVLLTEDLVKNVDAILRRSRVLPIQPNAMHWLKSAYDLRRREDQILPNHNTFAHRFVDWREAKHDMTFWRGKQDILRHSYGTHRMATVRNAHQVAEEMGNSVAIVKAL
jgi:hypothetical protein